MKIKLQSKNIEYRPDSAFVHTIANLPVRRVSWTDFALAHLVANVHGDIQEFKLQGYTQYGIKRIEYQTIKKLRTINKLNIG